MILLAAALASTAPLSEAEELNTITAELEAREDWKEQDRVRAEALARLRLDDWGDCLRNAKVRLGRSSEPVETVVTAIFGSFVREERVYSDALILSFRGRIAADKRVDLARGIVGRTRAEGREMFVAQLVNERITAARPTQP